MRMLPNGGELLTKEEFYEMSGLAFHGIGLFNDVGIPTIGAGLPDDGRTIVEHGWTPWLIAEYKRGSRIKAGNGWAPSRGRHGTLFTVRSTRWRYVGCVR